MNIRQCYISVPIRGSRFTHFLSKYGLVPYGNKNLSSFFFGLYNSKEDIKTLKRHKNLAVVIWRGGDIFRPGHLKIVRDLDFATSIAISSFIEDDLRQKRMSYKFLPIVSVPTKHLVAEPLGQEVYAYIGNKKKGDVYGSKLIDKVAGCTRFKINVVTSADEYTKEQIVDLYKRCFCGFRFTKHDGIANTVIELGLMGRKCFYNGRGVPNAIPWNSNDVNNVIQNIEKEALKIGQIDHGISRQVREYITLGKDWLKTSFYGDKKCQR